MDIQSEGSLVPQNIAPEREHQDPAQQYSRKACATNQRCIESAGQGSSGKISTRRVKDSCRAAGLP